MKLEDSKRSGLAAVYVIEIADGMVKVGFSGRPKERAAQINNLHRGSALLCCFWMEEDKARRLEESFHRKFKGKPIHATGELYYLDAETAIAMIKKMAKGKAMMEGLEKLDLTFQQTPSQYASWNERVLLGMPVRSKLRRRPAP